MVIGYELSISIPPHLFLPSIYLSLFELCIYYPYPLSMISQHPSLIPNLAPHPGLGHPSSLHIHIQSWIHLTSSHLSHLFPSPSPLPISLVMLLVVLALDFDFSPTPSPFFPFIHLLQLGYVYYDYYDMIGYGMGVGSSSILPHLTHLSCPAIGYSDMKGGLVEIRDEMKKIFFYYGSSIFANHNHCFHPERDVR